MSWRELICWIKREHMWAEWEQSDRPRKEFFKGTILLKEPYCVRCGLTKKGENITNKDTDAV